MGTITKSNLMALLARHAVPMSRVKTNELLRRRITVLMINVFFNMKYSDITQHKRKGIGHFRALSSNSSLAHQAPIAVCQFYFKSDNLI